MRSIGCDAEVMEAKAEEAKDTKRGEKARIDDGREGEHT